VDGLFKKFLTELCLVIRKLFSIQKGRNEDWGIKGNFLTTLCQQVSVWHKRKGMDIEFNGYLWKLMKKVGKSEKF